MTFTDYPVATFGGTLQISVFNGLSPTQSIDFAALPQRSDGDGAALLHAARATSPASTGWPRPSSTVLGTTLQDVDNAELDQDPARLRGRRQPARAVRGACASRPTSRCAASSTSSSTSRRWCRSRTSRRARESSPELFGSVGVRLLLRAHRPDRWAPTVGVQRPATFTPPAGQSRGPAHRQHRRLAAPPRRRSSSATKATSRSCPDGHQRAPLHAVPIFAAKLEVREDFLEWFAAILQVYYQYDGNQTQLAKAADGTSEPRTSPSPPARLQPDAASPLLTTVCVKIGRGAPYSLHDVVLAVAPGALRLRSAAGRRAPAVSAPAP